VTVDKATGQASPTSQRDIQFVVSANEPLFAAPAAGAFSFAGSTAGNPRVTQVVQVSTSSFVVTVRADSGGDIVLGLPAGAVKDVAGNVTTAASAPATPGGNVVTYVSPLSRTPDTMTLEEGGGSDDVWFHKAIATSSPITITVQLAAAGLASAAPNPLSFQSSSKHDAVHITPVEDLPSPGNKTTAITYVVTSADPNYNGLMLEATALTIIARPPDVEIHKEAWLDVPEGARGSYEDVIESGAEQIASGETLPSGTQVTWTYLVENTGGKPLSDLVVNDSAEGHVCDIAALPAHQSVGCVKTGTVRPLF
jgi:hypothetical protein